MDWAAFGSFLNSYGWAGITLVSIGWFFVVKIWPLVEKFVSGILENMKQQTQILDKISQWQSEQDRRTAQHVLDTERIAQMMREKR